ncbi:MAG: FISUMP domain-containing protein [Bacteroidales bacterium]
MKYSFVFSFLFFGFLLFSCHRNDEPVPLPKVLLTGDSLVVTYDSVVTLDAEPLKKGLDGYWTVVTDDKNYFLTDSLDPQAVFHGNYGMEYTLFWTVSNGEREVRDSILISLFRSIPEVILENDHIGSYLEDNEISALQLKSGLTGHWSLLTGEQPYSIENPDAAVTGFSGKYGQSYVISWSVSNGKESLTDTLYLSIYRPLPEVLISGEKSLEVYSTDADLEANPLSSGLYGEWVVVEGPSTWSIEDINNPVTSFSGELTGEYSLKWKVSNGKDTASEMINLKLVGITDSRDGQKYKVVKIGEQIWMAENLRAVDFQNGDPIPDGTGIGDYSGQASPLYRFVYSDNESNAPIYGRLYTYYAITDYRRVCPVEWHVPSETEWKKLMMELGMSSADVELIDYRQNTVAGQLKETGTVHWDSPNEGATNSSGFTALPAGYKRRLGEFNYIHQHGFFWSSTSNDTDNAWYFSLAFDKAGIGRSFNLKNYGFSVRCIKD